MKNRRLELIAAAILVVALVGCSIWAVVKPTPEKERKQVATERLKSLLCHPNTLEVHSVKESPWGHQKTPAVEIRFSAEGNDGQQHVNIYLLLFLADGTTEEELPADPEHPDQYPYDPHGLFR